MAVWALVVFGTGGFATGEEPRDAARRLYASAMTSVRGAKYDDAVRDFEAAYQAVPNPMYVFQEAQALRLARRPVDAIKAYERYLKIAPTAPNHDAVAEIVDELRASPEFGAAEKAIKDASARDEERRRRDDALAHPRNVPPHALDGDALSRPDPHLPDAARARLAGSGDVPYTAKLCVDYQGKVYRFEPVTAMPDADEAIRRVVSAWRYKPQASPVCLVATWVFHVE